MANDKHQQEKFERYSEQMGYRDFEEGEPDEDGRARYRNPNTQGRWNFWCASRDALASHTGEADPVARSVTSEEDKVLRSAILSSSEIVAHGRLATPPAATPATPGTPDGVQLLPWQAITEDDLSEYERFLVGEGVKNAGFFPVDANRLANIAMHCIREVRATRAALSNPAPVAAPAPKDWPLPCDVTIGKVTFNAGGNTLQTIIDSMEFLLRRKALAAPAPASEAVAKWIDDPHDIEQGMMLNPAWLKLHSLTAQEAVVTPTPGDSADAPVQQAGDEITTDGLGLDWVHSVLQWAASGYVHTPERMRSLRGAYRVVDRLVNEAALKGEQPVEPSGGERVEVA